VLFRIDEYHVGEEENVHRRDEDEGKSEDGDGRGEERRWGEREEEKHAPETTSWPARDRHTSPLPTRQHTKARRAQRLYIFIFDILRSSFFMFIRTIRKQTNQKRISRYQYKPFNTKQILNMPLIDPVTTSLGGDPTKEWQNKLVGKKLGDAHDEIVSLRSSDEPLLWFTDSCPDFRKE
jgi:hypothetical protein